MISFCHDPATNFINGFNLKIDHTGDTLSHSERRLAAIMFTDIAGYTALGQRNESLSIALVEEQRKLLRPIFKRHGGREIKTMGDAFLVEFPSALEAARCAYDIQRVTREFNITLPEEKRIHLRVGVHLGDVVESHGDISGDAVNLASRIESFAEAGGVCLTRQVYDHIHNKFELPLTSIGEKSLKNVSSPVEVYKMVMPWEGATASEVIELDKHRIAVLPLKNMSPDPNDEYFADGMTEELITVLSGVRELTVIARTSVMQYKDSPKRVADVARELRTGTVIEGSVRKAANKVRITVQMVDAGTEGHLWAQNYDRQMDDIFAIQSEIAEKVADALKVKLVESERRRLETRPTDNVEVYNLYLKGRYYWGERNDDSVKRAIGYFKAALEKDPGFALGYAGLADCYFVTRGGLLVGVGGEYQKAKEYAAKALSIDDDLAEAHTTMAFLRLDEEHDFKGAEAEFKRAIRLNPNYATAHHWYSQCLSYLGRNLEAMAEIRRALEIDPLSPIMNNFLGELLYFTGNFQAAVEQYEKVLEISPEFYIAYASMIPPLCKMGQFEKAMRALNELSKKAMPILAKTFRAYVLAHTDKEKARKLIEEVQKEDTQGTALLSVLAGAAFLLGEVETGFTLLEQSFQRHDIVLLRLKNISAFDEIRSDPRYLSMLKKLGLG